MALQDAILEIADALAADAEQFDSEPWPSASLLHGYVRQLRMAVKAAEGTQPNPIASVVLGASNEAAAYQNQRMVEEARAELRRGRHTAFQQEQKEARMVMAIGGPEDGVYVPVDPHMPVGARCDLSGTVYELRADGQLHVIL